LSYARDLVTLDIRMDMLLEMVDRALGKDQSP